MTRDVNLFIIIILHILEPHIILINNSYKIMQKVQECLVNKQSVFSKRFLQHAILKAASSLQGQVILLYQEIFCCKEWLRKPGFFH